MLDKNEWIRPWAGSDDEVTKMLDIKLIRENPDKIKAGLKAKEVDCDELIDRILELDEQRRTLLQQTEALKAEQNKVSKQIPALKKAGEDTTAIFKEMGEIKGKISALDGQLRDVVNEYQQDLYCLPNMPDDDLLPGGKENNEPLRYFGEPKKFDFEPKNHVDLCTNLGLIDYERGVKLAGNGFWIYKGMGARLEWALLNYFIDTHLADGYEMNMLPTAEAALASVYRDEILTEADLPKKFFSYTPCFRREAGSYRADERGMVRGHQFNKVEMFQYTLPEKSDEAFEELVTKAENLVKGLGFHFRTVKLAAGDCSASMARTYDIEISIPSMNGYKEVSSVSNARDYQARRGNMRVRRADRSIQFMHTLNGSGLATSRVLPALVEQNQLKDGSIVVPEVLRKYLGGIEVISK